MRSSRVGIEWLTFYSSVTREFSFDVLRLLFNVSHLTLRVHPAREFALVRSWDAHENEDVILVAARNAKVAI